MKNVKVNSFNVANKARRTGNDIINGNINTNNNGGMINNFRVIEYENSNNENVGFDIVVNRSHTGSVARYENQPFIRNPEQIVILDT